MNRSIIGAVAVFGWILAGPVARSQSTINSVRIYSNPPGLNFEVDGQTFNNAVDLFWPATSKHIVTGPAYQVHGTQMFTYVGAVTNLSALPVGGLPITADPALKSIVVTFARGTVPLTLDLPDCPASVKVCPCAVRIEIGGVLYDRRTTLLVAPGATIHARAFPNDGFIFTGWSPVPELGRRTEYEITFPVVGPMVLIAYGQAANDIGVSTTVLTDPVGLEILVDRTLHASPIALQWGLGTVHAVGAEGLQFVRGLIPYVFDSWSDGGALNHDVTVPSTKEPMTLTAKFLPAIPVGLATVPAGLALSVDGRQAPIYNFYWAEGTTHKISAPKVQADTEGRRYRFVSWSNGQPADWTFTTGATPPDGRIRAVYELMASVTFNTVPPGLPLQVDGASCDTPCTIDKAVGSSVSVIAAAIRRADDRSRLAFQGWNDSTEANRAIVLPTGSKTYTATYTLQHRLTVAAAPPEGASLALNPASADGFYDTGALVSVAARVAAGYRMIGWSGDLSGASTVAALTVDAPRNAVLLLDKVPAIAPLGVRSAALGADAGPVAPGSLISIFGANLAADLAIGPPNPLEQTLAGVTVRCDDTFLPLIFVSPSQINAQLPAAISEGVHRIVVRWEGKPETVAQITVARNAPGLFGGAPPDQFGSFLRPSGQAVTADDPARAGEVVGLLGTGLGPYVLQPLDGFLFNEADGYALKDDVTVIVNDLTIKPVYAGRSGAAVGVDVVRFQVPATPPDSTFLSVKVRINGQESNTVRLPVSR